MRTFCCFVVLFCLSAVITTGQTKEIYHNTSTYAMKTDGKELNALTIKLIRPYRTDSQKVSAIFRWITHHIAYDVIECHKKEEDRYCAVKERKTDPDPAVAVCDYNFAVADMVFKNRKAICDGYSRLLKVMCDIAGIECKMIRGCARNSSYPVTMYKGFVENHAWNMVKINGTWRLLDATWASGFTDKKATIFTRSYDEAYYFPYPAVFAYSHYPVNESCLLVDQPEGAAKFISQPYRYREFYNSGVRSFSPATSVLRYEKDSTIRFHLRANDSIRSVFIAPDEEEQIIYVYVDTLYWVDAGPDIALMNDKASITGKKSKRPAPVVLDAEQEEIASVLEYVHARDSVSRNKKHYAESMPGYTPPLTDYDIKGKEVFLHYKPSLQLYRQVCFLYGGERILLYDLQ